MTLGMLHQLAIQQADVWEQFGKAMEANPMLGPDEACPELVKSLDKIRAMLRESSDCIEFFNMMDLPSASEPIILQLVREARWRVCRRMRISFQKAEAMHLLDVVRILQGPSVKPSRN